MSPIGLAAVGRNNLARYTSRLLVVPAAFAAFALSIAACGGQPGAPVSSSDISTVSPTPAVQATRVPDATVAPTQRPAFSSPTTLPSSTVNPTATAQSTQVLDVTAAPTQEPPSPSSTAESSSGTQSSAEVIHVTSSDGSASLDIPIDALPAGIAPDSVKIAKVDAKDLDISFGDETPSVTYDLQPSGLRFTKPVTMTVEIAGSLDSIPTVWLVSEDGLEPVGDVRVSVDAEAGVVLLSAPIQHFSSFVVRESSIFKVKLSNPGDQHVGRPFKATAELWVERKDGLEKAYKKEPRNADTLDKILAVVDVVLLAAEENHVTLTNMPLVEGSFEVSRGSLSPSNVPNAPPSTRMGQSVFCRHRDLRVP